MATSARAAYEARRHVGKGGWRLPIATLAGPLATLEVSAWSAGRPLWQVLHSDVSTAAVLVEELCLVLEVLLAIGLVVRDRVRQCYTLWVLTLAWLASALAVRLRPTWLTWEFWTLTELTHAVLAFLLALEVIARAFRQVPAAWWWSRTILIGATLLSAGLVYASPPGPFSVRVLPWLLGGLACLYMSLWVMALLLDLPQERLHVAILGGLSPYLIVYAVTWGQTEADTTLANRFNPIMFTVALGVLVHAAWRHETETPAHPETVRWLFPWRF